MLYYSFLNAFLMLLTITDVSTANTYQTCGPFLYFDLYLLLGSDVQAINFDKDKNNREAVGFTSYCTCLQATQ